MIYIPEKYRSKKIIPVNKNLSELKGELEDKQARITLAQFLNSNLDVASELLLGIKLEHFQHLTINTMFKRSFSLNVWGRSVSKSFTARIFAILYAIFNPGSKIILTGPTFRTAKIMFHEIAKLVRSPDAKLLHDVFDEKNKKERNEMHTWTIPIAGKISEIIAIPLSGEKIRGLRANILIIDEFLLMPRDLVKRVLIPFILSPQDLQERQKIVAQEDMLVKAGKMTDAERTKFESTAKLIALSSASYQFEFLYELYQEWIQEITDESKPVKAKYFVSRLSYEAAPPHMLEMDVIEDQKKDQGSPWFQREYEARFLDDSDSYFSAKVMHKCTFEIGDKEGPTLALFGNGRSDYIISIDPNYSNAENADHFAMSVVKVSEAGTATYVHGYGTCGAKLPGYAAYLRYLVDAFDPCMIIIDNGGADHFIDGCNAEYFKNDKLEVLDFISHKEGTDYIDELRKAKAHYDKERKIYVVKQLFTSTTIRSMNEHLQKCFAHRKMLFGSRINGNDDAYDSFLKSREIMEKHLGNIHFFEKMPKNTSFQEKMIDMIDRQDMMLDLTIKECSLVEVKSSPTGNQTFDLPSKFKRDTSNNRIRKDNYSSLLLGCWGAKIYNELRNFEEQKIQTTFDPILI